MAEYYVTTIEVEPMLTVEQRELILELPIDETIKNKFPFDDVERSNVEVFKIGTEEECQNYIDEINDQIKDYFTTNAFDEEDYSNPLIFDLHTVNDPQ